MIFLYGHNVALPTDPHLTHSHLQHLTDSHPPQLFTTQKNIGVVASTKSLFKINRGVFIVVIQSCVNWGSLDAIETKLMSSFVSNNM